MRRRSERAGRPKTFDRRDAISLMHHRERQAGVDAAALNNDRAGATLAVIAALFGAGELQVLSQSVQKRRTYVEFEISGCPVDLEGDPGRHRRVAG
jgi:hypothetical protein